MKTREEQKQEQEQNKQEQQQQQQEKQQQHRNAKRWRDDTDDSFQKRVDFEKTPDQQEEESQRWQGSYWWQEDVSAWGAGFSRDKKWARCHVETLLKDTRRRRAGQYLRFNDGDRGHAPGTGNSSANLKRAAQRARAAERAASAKDS